jgi:hypothetical protein
VFVVGEGGDTVKWQRVTVGIREGDRIQVEGEGEGLGERQGPLRVVILGQQLLDDGSPITIPDLDQDTVESTRSTRRSP